MQSREDFGGKGANINNDKGGFMPEKFSKQMNMPKIVSDDKDNGSKDENAPVDRLAHLY